jgi:two-component system sensor histidine kinase MprB
LVNDLIELARANGRPLATEPVVLDELVGSVVERSRRSRPDVCFAVDSEPTVVVADGEALERAIANLIDNALKWSPRGGVVRVRVGGGEVVVEDEGPGIAEADLPHVFDRFYRAAGARALPGSGLGLAIVRQVAEAHGGSVSAAPGARGARLRLSIPVAGAQTVAQTNL